jgi:putative flippase GtrA
LPGITDRGTGFAELLSPTRMGRFLSVGVAGAVCDNAVLIGLVEVGHVAPTVAKLASAEAAILLMFVLNRNWTFADAAAVDVRGLVRRFLTSNIVRAGGAGTALAVLFVLHGQFGVWYLLANVFGM